MSTYLCFDFGTKRIGVAVGQTLTCTAQPVTTLKAQDGIPQWDSIKRLITEWQPDGLVVGIPVQMDGSTQLMTNAAQRFANRLKERYHLPVYGTDERLTSREARLRIYEAQGYKGLVKKPIDDRAAVIILEAWMQEKETHEKNETPH
ncbi:MAG: Holliday junction resolvase RuvX [Gammaproteobacteria bacterium]